jgi:hypothetical protein
VTNALVGKLNEKGVTQEKGRRRTLEGAVVVVAVVAVVVAVVVAELLLLNL